MRYSHRVNSPTYKTLLLLAHAVAFGCFGVGCNRPATSMDSHEHAETKPTASLDFTANKNVRSDSTSASKPVKAKLTSMNGTKPVKDELANAYATCTNGKLELTANTLRFELKTDATTASLELKKDVLRLWAEGEEGAFEGDFADDSHRMLVPDSPTTVTLRDTKGERQEPLFGISLPWPDRKSERSMSLMVGDKSTYTTFEGKGCTFDAARLPEVQTFIKK